MATDDTPYDEIQSSPEESNINSPSLLSEGINPVEESDVIFECTVPAKVPKILENNESEHPNTVTIFNNLLHNAANTLQVETKCKEDTMKQGDNSVNNKGTQLHIQNISHKQCQSCKVSKMNSFGKHSEDLREESLQGHQPNITREDSLQGKQPSITREDSFQGKQPSITKEDSFQGKQPSITKEDSFQGKQPSITREDSFQGKQPSITKEDSFQGNQPLIQLTENNFLKNIAAIERNLSTSNQKLSAETDLSLRDIALKKSVTHVTSHQILSEDFTFNFPPLTPPQISPLTEDSLLLDSDSSALLPTTERCNKAVQTLSSGQISMTIIYTGDLVTEDK